jgi:hypothetical protein
VVVTTYNPHVRLLSPELLWLVGTTEVYSGAGADIVMESISLADPDPGGPAQEKTSSGFFCKFGWG